MGVHGDHPPTDPDGVNRFAVDLALPDLHRALLDAEPLDAPVAKVSGVAWALSSGADLVFPGVGGNRTRTTSLLGRYVARIRAGATSDPSLGRAFLRVTSMVDPPQALLRPGTLIGATSASPRT